MAFFTLGLCVAGLFPLFSPQINRIQPTSLIQTTPFCKLMLLPDFPGNVAPSGLLFHHGRAFCLEGVYTFFPGLFAGPQAPLWASPPLSLLSTQPHSFFLGLCLRFPVVNLNQSYPRWFYLMMLVLRSNACPLTISPIDPLRISTINNLCFVLRLFGLTWDPQSSLYVSSRFPFFPRGLINSVASIRPPFVAPQSVPNTAWIFSTSNASKKHQKTYFLLLYVPYHLPHRRALA